jgi:hypothetical protein
MIGKRPLTRVDIEIDNNVWWDDAFQFGQLDDQTWNFTGMNFYLNVQVHDTDTVPLLALSSLSNTILVEDPINRILQMNVADGAIRTALPVGKYVYDLIMVNSTTGQTDGLMYGTIDVKQGVTVGPS